MKAIFTFILLFFGTLISTKAQSFASARIIEYLDASRIIVVYETGESKVIQMEYANETSAPKKNNERLISNQRIINKFLSEMKDSGYTLLDVSARQKEYYSERLLLFSKD